MKKLLNKKNQSIIIFIFILLFLIHLPLMTKNIISADILLNNYFYNGYSWEISLGRFGLYIVGIIKSFITIPHIDLIISYILISITIVLIIDLFKVKDKIKIILIILVITLNPITSATLLFYYCSIGYTLALLSSTLAIYLYKNIKNKYLKILFPTTLIIIALSMYQAYLSLIVTLFIVYLLFEILNKKDIKDTLKYLLVIILGIIIYFVIMKLSLQVFHINMSNYSNANSTDIKILLNIPQKIIDSYKLFYQFYFTNNIIKNTFIHNDIINLLIIITILIELIYKTVKNKLSTINKLLILLIIILIPIALNSVIFVISDTKLQLLMASSYLLIPIIMILLIENSKKNISLLILILLFRNNIIQTQSTYLTLENTFNKYNLVISTAIKENINNLDKSYALIGKAPKQKDNISKLNYGFISDDSIFWKEYNIRKLGLTKFCKEYYGLNINYIDKNKAKYLEDNKTNKLIETKDNIIVINLDYLK